jgi:hypothetical protein
MPEIIRLVICFKFFNHLKFCIVSPSYPLIVQLITSENMSGHVLPLGTAPGKRNDAWIVERRLPDGVRQPFICQLNK